MGTDLIISQELAQRIANYLAQRPWQEVEPLMHGLQELAPSEPGEEN